MERAGFVRRDQLGEYEWDNQRKDWSRPPVDRDVLKRLSERNTANGVLRILYFVALLSGAAVATMVVVKINPWLALPILYGYYFLYGFWVAIGHELQHKTVFAKSEDWLNEIVFFFVQTIMWNSPTYARISHRLHHRYTMVRGFDPETDWPEVITRRWLRLYLVRLLLKVLVVGAIVDLIRTAKTQISRAVGRKDWMMRDHCNEEQIRAIRIESAAILLVHTAAATIAIAFGVWEILVFLTIAWQIGSPIEQIWHATKHIGRPYNVRDHRLNTRSVRVGWFIRPIFWGLDDHVDHHLYPAVPSRNLRKLHALLEPQLPEPESVFGCWAEMFEIAREKERDPRVEYTSVGNVPPVYDLKKGEGSR